MLEIQLGSRVRHQRSVRQYRSRTLATGCPEAREMQVGAAVHRTVADGADGTRGWDEGRAYAWYPSRWRYDALNAKDNFRFERRICGWKWGLSLVDMRRKR